jgi:hypothetical protein
MYRKKGPYPFFGLVLAVSCLLGGAPTAETTPSWLDRLNYYRGMAALPPVGEDQALSGAVLQHARYMVMHAALRHSEEQGKAWATPEGAAAGAASNLAGSTRPTEPDSWAIDVWMQAPFHALGILDPGLHQVGFGIFRAPHGTIQTAAGLDVIRGRATPAASAAYPIVWPADGAFVPLTTHRDEYPSPLTSCPGYRAPTGLPLIVQLGSGNTAPHVTGTWIAEGDRLLEHCAFDEGSYRNRDDVAQRLGRSILAARNAIVLIPREPLRPGAVYRAVVEVNGRQIDWTFGVSRADFGREAEPAVPGAAR